MDAWPRFERACLDRHGVGDVALARALGVSADRFLSRTSRDGWQTPFRGVRLHPEAPPSVQQRVVICCVSSADLAAASGEVAAWLHGLRDRPPEQLEVLGRHGTRCRRHGGVHVRRARWLDADDVGEVQGVPTLLVPAMFLSSLGMRLESQWARLIDAVHRELTTPSQILDRLARVGPLAGKGALREQCERLAHLRVESVFQDDVAGEFERRGYAPERSTRHIPTPDGIGVEVDVPLPRWQVALEPEGDAYHRTREQRRADRRREAAFAATDWVRVPVDWRDWHLERDHVFDAADDAIDAQRRRGIGTDHEPPRRPRGRRGHR